MRLQYIIYTLYVRTTLLFLCGTYLHLYTYYYTFRASGRMIRTVCYSTKTLKSIIIYIVNRDLNELYLKIIIRLDWIDSNDRRRRRLF